MTNTMRLLAFIAHKNI